MKNINSLLLIILLLILLLLLLFVNCEKQNTNFINNNYKCYQPFKQKEIIYKESDYNFIEFNKDGLVGFSVTLQSTNNSEPVRCFVYDKFNGKTYLLERTKIIEKEEDKEEEEEEEEEKEEKENKEKEIIKPFTICSFKIKYNTVFFLDNQSIHCNVSKTKQNIEGNTIIVELLSGDIILNTCGTNDIIDIFNNHKNKTYYNKKLKISK